MSACARQATRRSAAGTINVERKYIEIRQLIFEGTYDAFKWDRVARRQRVFDASLFGSLLPPDAWGRVPEDRVPALIAAAPSFKPEAVGKSIKAD